MRSIKIKLPDSPYLRSLYLAFIKLIDKDYANIRPLYDTVEIEAKDNDIRPVLSSAIKYAIELGTHHKNRDLPIDFPLSANDNKIKKKLMKELKLSEQDSMLSALEEYSKIIEGKNVKELKNALLSNNGDLSPFNVFLLELYQYTRAPFFNGKHKHGLKMNMHQMLICTAGYMAARHCRSSKGDESITVLILPINLRVTNYDFYRNLRDSIGKLPGTSPEEAVILWFALHLHNDFLEDIIILGIKEPIGNKKSIELVASIPLNLNELWLRSGKRLEILKSKQEDIKILLEYALKKGTKPQPKIDDAIEYVKLLYLAIQGFERERLELALRASRREVVLAFKDNKEEEKKRMYVAKIAREISQLLD